MYFINKPLFTNRNNVDSLGSRPAPHYFFIEGI